ncbi:MAG: dipeptidase [Candidatus Cryptobacteroides sp.]
MYILDSHCDTPSQIIRLRNLAVDNPFAHVDFPKMIRGHIDASFFALYTPGTMEPDSATRYALQMLAAVKDSVEESSDIAALARTPEEALLNKRKGLISIFIGMENGLPVQNDLSLLREFHRMGVSYMTLTHNTDNQICDSAAVGRRWHGISPFGRQVIAEMNRLGMIIDLAHASDEAFFDCIRCSKAPVVSTHSCCRALAGHRRNMSDEMLKALSANGGVIQINFYPLFLSDDFAKVLDESGLDGLADSVEAEFIKDPADPEKYRNWIEILQKLERLERPSYKRVVDHIDHAVSVAGIDHVGIGSDFDGINVTPSGLEDISKTGIIFEEMRRRGYSENEISMVAGGNFLRVMKEIQELAVV